MRRNVVDITGLKYGKLSVLEYIGWNGLKSIYRCLCDCGNEIIANSNALKSGNTKSCGCLKKARKHGMSKTRIYSIWTQMFERCYRNSSPNYKNYGGRGIGVCHQWQEFNAFYADMKNGYSDDLSIDRIDNNGNYEPGNCRWVTPEVQSFNRRNTLHITIGGVTKTSREWATISPVTEKTIRMRLWWGRSPEDAVFTPLKNNKRTTKIKNTTAL